MNQLNGSSVQTKIEKKFPPERYRVKMVLNCFVLGNGTTFTLPFSETIVIKKEEYHMKSVTIDNLKEYIYERKYNILNDLTNDASKLELWHVNVDEVAGVFTKDDIVQKLKGNKMISHLLLSKYVSGQPPEEKIHIIIQPPATTVSPMYIPSDEIKIEIKNKVVKAFPDIDPLSIDQLVDALALIWDVKVVKKGSSLNDPCVKLKMEPSFFKINLPCTITKQSTTLVDLCLPPYKSKSGTSYLNPFYDDPQFKDTVSLVRKKLINDPRDITVLAGVSGGGKTSTAFGIATDYWSIYIDFSPSGAQYGDFLGEELEKIRAIPPMYGQTKEQKKVFDLLDLAIVSRGLLLIRMFVQEEISIPKEWLFAQLQIETKKFPEKLHNHNIHISSLIDDINQCLGVESLILIFDEAQELCKPAYGEYSGSSSDDKEWNLLQAYIGHLTHFHVTCLLVGTRMHMLSGTSLLSSVGKAPQSSRDHIVLKLPFLSHVDVMRNLKAVIDLSNVSSQTLSYLGYLLMGRPRNCASFVHMLISERVPTDKTKDQEILDLVQSWYEKICKNMAKYLKDTCKYLGANNFNPETAIIDVLRLRVFYNHKYKAAIEFLQHSIIPCMSPESITLVPNEINSSIIEINPSFESYLVSSIELYLKTYKRKSLIETFIDDNILRLNNNSSIGNEFDAAFITAIIQKRRLNVREELNRWKNGQQFDLPLWITSTMKFATISNLSGAVPIDEYVCGTYCHYAIQPDIYSGSDLVISLTDDDQNIVLLSASCTVSGSPIERNKVKKQLIKSSMKFQYMEFSSNKPPPCIHTGNGEVNDDLEEDEEEEDEEEEYEEDLNFGGADYDLDYTENTKNYQVSNIPERAEKHEKIKTSRHNKKHIYVSVELPHRRGKRSELFRLNKDGDLVIIIDDRNMEHIFGPIINKLVENLRERSNKNQDSPRKRRKQENQTE